MKATANLTLSLTLVKTSALSTWSQARRRNDQPRRVNVDFPAWVVDRLDKDAGPPLGRYWSAHVVDQAMDCREASIAAYQFGIDRRLTACARKDAMSKKSASYTLDMLPPLTEKQRQYLDALASRPDDQTDLSDMPELTDAQLAEMKPAAHYRPVKKQITARVDADVLAWLKAQGKGYQSRINAILRREMLKQQQTNSR